MILNKLVAEVLWVGLLFQAFECHVTDLNSNGKFRFFNTSSCASSIG